MNDQTPPGRVAAPQSPSTFRQVFGISEFRALWTAQVLSVVGDQLARVALTLLVFQRTGSALLAAITFAASIVPAFVGGVTLSGLADRLPRRQVMIASDLARVVLVAIMAIPGLPVFPMICIFGVVTLIGAPFNAARAALYPDILTGDLYVLGTAVTLTTLQFAQVIGFAAGGAIVAVFGVRTSLLVDSATFLVSALITRALVRARPTARDHAAGPPPVLVGSHLGDPAGVRQSGAAHPDAARLARRVLRRARGRGSPAFPVARRRGPGGGPDPGRVRTGRLPRCGGVQPPGRSRSGGCGG